MLYTKKQLEEIIPHRYEMSLLDGILEINDNQIIGIMKLKDNWFFKGHFPKKPVMPGVLQIEALAQTGACYLLSLEKYQGQIAYFTGIDKVKFKDMVLPGDQIHLVVEMNQIKDMGKHGSFGKGVGKVLKNNKIVTSCELSFYIK